MVGARWCDGRKSRRHASAQLRHVGTRPCASHVAIAVSPAQASITANSVHAAVVFAKWVPEAREELALASRWLAERVHPGFADIPTEL